MISGRQQGTNWTEGCAKEFYSYCHYYCTKSYERVALLKLVSDYNVILVKSMSQCHSGESTTTTFLSTCTESTRAVKFGQSSCRSYGRVKTFSQILCHKCLRNYSRNRVTVSDVTYDIWAFVLNLLFSFHTDALKLINVVFTHRSSKKVPNVWLSPNKMIFARFQSAWVGVLWTSWVGRSKWDRKYLVFNKSL